MQIPNDRGISTKKCNGGNAMGITGVGSSYNFVYNTKTGKLSTKDGSKNEFVDFCNGDVKGEDTEEKETKAESQVHSALKMTYYEAFSEARKALNSEEKTGSVGENIILQDNFDMKAWSMQLK